MDEKGKRKEQPLVQANKQHALLMNECGHVGRSQKKESRTSISFT
jgi:hypothetical protein